MDVNTVISELGISIKDVTFDKSRTKTKTYNSKFKIFREFILATLSALAEIKSKQIFTKEPLKLSQVYALDASACAGIAGLQWKKHLTSSVHVTVATQDDVKEIVNNAEANMLHCSELKLNPQRVPGDLLDLQNVKEVNVCKAETKMIMAMEAFNFIYLSPGKICPAYFDSALQNITSDGILCTVIPDVSQFARSPHVVQRFYAADVVKTEYIKELAARIVLANLARAAARHIKGISPQYVLSHDDNLLICVKISRGNNAADSSVTAIEKLLHCRLCEQRIFLPNQLAPLDDPYNLLSCNCKKNNPGKTAVILGPAWKESLSDPSFLIQLYKHGNQLKLGQKFNELVNLLLAECVCSTSDRCGTAGFGSELKEETLSTRSKDCSGSTCESKVSFSEALPSNTTEDTLCSTKNKTSSESNMETQVEISSSVDEANETEDENVHTNGQPQNHTEQCSTVQKRKAENAPDSTDNGCKTKRQKKDKESDTAKTSNVPFYYNITKFKKSNIPKLAKIVTILHCSGHRASRTHFDSCAIRTSASVEEFVNIFG